MIELGRIFDHIYPHYVSAGARLGFLLKLAQMETATKTPAVKFATRLGKLLSRTRVTCNRSSEKGELNISGNGTFM